MPSLQTPLQGETLDGHDLDLLRVGREGEGKRRIWVVARQHPGESMAGALGLNRAPSGHVWLT